MSRIFVFQILMLYPVVLLADSWKPITNSEEVKALFNEKHITATISEGDQTTAYYHSNGTAEVHAWGEVFQRKWKVEGNGNACLLIDDKWNCFKIEQNMEDSHVYRATHLTSGQEITFSETKDQISIASSQALKAGNEGGAAQPSAAEVAAALSNPNTALGTMNFNLDYISFGGDLPGASDQSALRMTFQPSLPYPLGKGVNFFLRPAIPIIFKQDVPVAGGFEEKGVDLGDIGYDAGVGKTYPGGLVLIGGVVGTIPTATDDALGKDQWLLGPEGMVAVVKKWGALGLLLTHQWDVAGEDSYDTNITAGQYFYVFNLQDGWQIRSGPTFSYDHEAPSGQRSIFPIGIGVNKTMIINGTPWKFGVEYWDYIEAPDAFAQDWQIRFVVAPVVPLPWGK